MQPEKLTDLNQYRLLGRSGLRISPLSLGTMTFGTEWGWGSDRSESRRLFDAYVDRGGNSIDTANFYTGGTSEEFLGEFIQGRREQLVLATKFTLNMRAGDPNAGGNHRKNIVQSCHDSLKRLRTDYIDLYYLHAWEYRTPIDEVMRALDDLVRAGKVLYVGISDAAAWKVAQANTIADFRGWTPFVALQIEYSLVERTVERDLIPMARELGVAVLPWSPLGGGVLTGKYNPVDPQMVTDTGSPRKDMNVGRLTDLNLKISEEVQRTAKETGRTPAQVALNWVLQKPGVVSPIIGSRTLRQLEDNLGSLDFVIPADLMARLDEMSKIDLGFPHRFLQDERVRGYIDGGADIDDQGRIPV